MGLVYLGESPAAEDCAPASEVQQSKKECRVLIRQLKRMFPDYEEHNCRIVMTRNEHDLADYYTVVVYYLDNDEDSIDYAYKMENEFPEYWDEIAKIELGPTLTDLIKDLPADLAAGPGMRYDSRRKVLSNGAS